MKGLVLDEDVMAGRVPKCPVCWPPTTDDEKKDESLAGGVPAGLLLAESVPWLTEAASDEGDTCSVTLRIPFRLSEEIAMHNEDVLRDERLSSVEWDPLLDSIDKGKFRTVTLQSASADKEVLDSARDALVAAIKSYASFGVLKPDVVLFGEPLVERFHECVKDDLATCDMMIVIGTSLQVAPVNSLAASAPHDVPAILINREIVGQPHEFDINLLGDSDYVVQHLLAELDWSTGSAEKHEPREYETEEDGYTHLFGTSA